MNDRFFPSLGYESRVEGIALGSEVEAKDYELVLSVP